MLGSSTFDGVQDMMARMGSEACLALCAVSVAAEATGRQLCPFESIVAGVQAGLISYDWSKPHPDDFWVKDPAAFVSLLTGGRWEYRHEAAGYVPGEGEYVANRYERKVTGGVMSHFERDSFKPLRNSQTVLHGTLASKRVWRAL